ncbi:MAG: hypothetical protein SFY66_05755 [Oculatellaceae cyanobacterium bins.114]|nr:hypothetical protein [Oculatellaceae cyanobacterium bins.114]
MLYYIGGEVDGSLSQRKVEYIRTGYVIYNCAEYLLDFENLHLPLSNDYKPLTQPLSDLTYKLLAAQVSLVSNATIRGLGSL